MRTFIFCLLFAALNGCALAPNSIRPEIQHISHLTQHEPFTSHPAEYGATMASVMAHWDLPHTYIEVGEGIALDHRSGCDQYQDRGYGELIGPREQFIARVGLIIPVK